MCEKGWEEVVMEHTISEASDFKDNGWLYRCIYFGKFVRLYIFMIYTFSAGMFYFNKKFKHFV
jgi:hypothetical protein